jgi:hypothetical protein
MVKGRLTAHAERLEALSIVHSIHEAIYFCKSARATTLLVPAQRIVPASQLTVFQSLHREGKPGGLP